MRRQLWDLACDMAFHEAAEASSAWEEVVLCILDRLPLNLLALLLPLEQNQQIHTECSKLKTCFAAAVSFPVPVSWLCLVLVYTGRGCF